MRWSGPLSISASEQIFYLWSRLSAQTAIRLLNLFCDVILCVCVIFLCTVCACSLLFLAVLTLDPRYGQMYGRMLSEDLLAFIL